MKRFVCILSAVIIIICVFTSCSPSRMLSTGKPELYAVANYSVPFVTGNYGWDELKVLEKDSYGRTMFKYRSNSYAMHDYSGKYISALVICQKYDEDYAYYYDNIDFVYLSDYADVPEADAERLKELNDWEKPLDELKMSKVKNDFFSIYKGEYKDDNILLSEYMPRKKDMQYKCDIITVDNSHRFLYIIREYTKNEKEYTFYDSYFLVCDKDRQLLTENGEPCILKIEDVVHCQDDMKTIKERSNWNKPR